MLRPAEGGHTVFTEYEGHTLQTRRDLKKEAELARAMFSCCPFLDVDEGWDWQLEGFHWMARLTHWGAGACLADDMGLGKTVQALALILSHAEHGPTLVIAPTSVCINWQTVVLDEAQAIKNVLSKRSKAALDLNAQVRLLTTGTPIHRSVTHIGRRTNKVSMGNGIVQSIKAR